MRVFYSSLARNVDFFGAGDAAKYVGSSDLKGRRAGSLAGSWLTHSTCNAGWPRANVRRSIMLNKLVVWNELEKVRLPIPRL